MRTGIPYIGVCGKCGARRVDLQLGLEPTPEDYIRRLCDVFDEVKRVLTPQGSCWVNLGDCYGGKIGEPNAPKLSEGRKGQYASAAHVKERLPAKSLVQIPARFQIEMSNRGWIVRNEIIWYKPNCMPQPAKDRFTIDFEKVFFFTKSRRYYFNTQYEPLADASLARKEYGVKSTRYQFRSQGGLEMEKMDGRFYNAEKGRIKRAVWRVPPRPLSEAHFATYPEALCEIPIDAGCPPGGVVLDCFFGSGTTGLVALKQDKDFVGIELNPEYITMAVRRLDPFMPVILAE